MHTTTVPMSRRRRRSPRGHPHLRHDLAHLDDEAGLGGNLHPRAPRSANRPSSGGSGGSLHPAPEAEQP